MMTKSFRRFSLILVSWFLGLGFAWLPPIAAHAVSISPALIEVKDILQNSSISKTVVFLRNNPSRTIPGQVVITGQAKDYIRLSNQGRVNLLKGDQQTQYGFWIEPGNLAPGTYEAKIAINPLATETDIEAASGSSSVFMYGAEATIRFTVSGEARESFEIQNPETHDTEEDMPVDYTFQVLNRGNVDTVPDKIEAIVTDATDPARTVREIVSGSELGIVKAFAERKIDRMSGIKLKTGQYLLRLKFFGRDGKLIFTSKDLRFQVFPRGTLSQKGELFSFGGDKDVYNAGELALFKGMFKNTGAIGVTATFNVEVLKDGQRLEILRSQPGFVPIGETFVFEAPYRFASPGKYEAIGSVNYGIYKTQTLRATFSVREGIRAVSIYRGLFSVLLLIILTILIRRLLRIRRQKKNALPPVSPTVPPADVAPPVPESALPSEKLQTEEPPQQQDEDKGFLNGV